jgi:hypothetical protein
MRNKLAQVFMVAFLDLYCQHWSSFFRDIMALFPVQIFAENKASSVGLDFSAVDFLLRVLLAIDEECVNPLIPRTKLESDRNTLIVCDEYEPMISPLISSHCRKIQ